MATLTYPYLKVDDRGVAWIEGANTKVIEVALDVIAHGSSPEEIHLVHRHLSIAQIHAALAYYYDHQTQLDEQIENSLAEADRLRGQGQSSPIRERLRRLGKLPPTV